MAYGLKYELLCTTRKGNLYTAKVYFDGYTGDPVDRNVPLNPFKLRKISKAVIRGSSFEYSIREEVNFEFLEFYTNSQKAVKVELYDPSNTLIWSGYNLPQQYQVPYVPAPASISFTATDGLGLLKNESFTLTGRNSQLDIIIHCIDKIGIDLSYSIAINTFETTHNESRSPLAQTYEDCERYTGLNCYEVVEKILQKYDAEITQRRGKWAITCTADKKSTRMIYTSAGVYSTTEAAPAVLDMGYPGAGIEVSPRNILQMSLEPGGKQVKLTQDFGRKDSLLNNYKFTDFTSLFPDWAQAGTYTVSQGDKDGVKYAYLEGYSNTDEYIEQQIDVDNVSGQDFVFSLKFAPIGRNLLLGLEFAVTMEVRVMVSVTDGVDTWYLTQNGWQDTYGLITLSLKSSIGYPVFNELQIISNEIPVSGIFTVRLYRYKHDTAGAGITYNGIAFKEVLTYFLNNGQSYPSALETTAVFDNSSEPENLNDINVFAGDAPVMPNNSLLYEKITRLSDDSPTTVWHRSGSVSEYTLLVQLARIIASNNRIARQKLTGDIKGTGIAFDSIIKHAYNSNREFEIAEGTWDIYEEVFSVTLLELLAWSSESITFTIQISLASTAPAEQTTTGSIIGVGISNGTTDAGLYLPAPLAIATNHYTGFPNRTDTTLSFNNSNRTLILSGTNFKIYVDGVEYTIVASVSKQIPDVTGLYWFWITIVDGEPVLNGDVSGQTFGSCLVASVYWNTDLDAGITSDERHWMGRDRWMHEYLHETVGAKYHTGGTLTPANTFFEITECEIYDEDIEHILPAAETCRVMYKDGSANWKWDDNSTTLYKLNIDAMRYNDGNNLADVGNDQYVAMWIYATGLTTYPFISIIGQRTDNTIAAARANNLPNSISYGTLPSAEIKLLYRVIFKQGVGVITYQETADYRNVSNVPVGNYTATDHSTLSKLAYDESGHTGFAPTPISDLLEWSTNKYQPYASKQAGGELYTGTVDPTETKRLNYNGQLYAAGVAGVGGVISGNITTSHVHLASTSINIKEGSTFYAVLDPNVANSGINAAYILDTKNALSGTTLLLSLRNQTAEKFSVADDGSVNIPTGATYNINGTPITGGATPVDSALLDWSTDRYIAYAAKGAGGELYTGTTDPDQTTRLNYNGSLFATNLTAITDANVGLVAGNHVNITPTEINIKVGTGAYVALTPHVSDSASAIGFKFVMKNALSTAGARLMSLWNNGSEKVAIHHDGKAQFGSYVLIDTYGIKGTGGGQINLQGATGLSGSVVGKYITLRGGDAYGTGDNDGGGVYIYGGLKNGAGITGKIYIGTGSAGTNPLAGSGARDSALLYNRNNGEITYGDMPDSKFVLSGALYETIDRNYCTETNTALLSSGRLSLVAIYIPKGITITSISFWSATTAGATLTNQLFGLYDSSLNLLRSSNNDTSTAWAANTRKTLLLTSTYVTTYSGIHYLGIMVAATTVPTLKGNTARTGGQLAASAPSMGGTSNTGLTTTLPNPANAPGTVTTTAWACVN